MGLLCFSAILVAFSARTHPVEHWQPRNGQGLSQTLNGIAYGNGRFVAVGSSLTPTGVTGIGFVLSRTNGIAVSSTNGIDWETKQLNVKQHLNAVIYANHRFVAVGNAGTILWSDDGSSWSNVSLPIAHNISAIGYGNLTNASNGLFVAFATSPGSDRLGDRTISLTSVDGISWQTNRLGVSIFGGSIDTTITSITFGQGRFFAAWSLPGPSQALVSNNGSNWTQSLIPTPNGIAGFGYNKFTVISGFVIGPPPTVFSLTSTNGYNWPSGTPVGSFRTPGGLCFDGKQFVAVGYTYTATSEDGTNWIVGTLTNSVSLKSVTHGNGIFAAVGTGRQVFTSPDGASWTQRSMTPNQHLLAVASSSNRCVAAGWAGTIAWSPTGEFWNSASTPTTNNLRAAYVGQSNYVFAGDLGTIVSGDDLASLLIRSSGTDKTLNGIASDDMTDVIVGDAGIVLTSENTVDWTLQNSTVANRLAAVAHGNGTFVAVGDAGTIVTSEDGQQWTRRTSGTSTSFRDIAFGNGVFIAICAFGSEVVGPFVFTSTNGYDWLPINSLPGESSIAFGNGFFVYPTHDDPSGALTRFHVSTDGRSWELRAFSPIVPSGALVNDLTYCGGAFVSVANNGMVWQSDPVFRVTWDAKSNSGNLVGPINGAYRVQVANELESPTWVDLTNLTSVPYIFADPEANSQSSRFYRAQFVE